MSDEQTEGTAAFEVGCGFLSVQELEQAVAGRLSEERRQEFERHVATGCSPCVMLAADLAVFRRLLVGGLTEAERAEADRQAETLSSRLLAAIRRRETIP
jgi:hypothetical protein